MWQKFSPKQKTISLLFKTIPCERNHLCLSNPNFCALFIRGLWAVRRGFPNASKKLFEVKWNRAALPSLRKCFWSILFFTSIFSLQRVAVTQLPRIFRKTLTFSALPNNSSGTLKPDNAHFGWKTLPLPRTSQPCLLHLIKLSEEERESNRFRFCLKSNLQNQRRETR